MAHLQIQTNYAQATTGTGTAAQVTP